MQRLGIFIAVLAWAAPAAADLYRWVDPETGSVKFSSYPPPWYGEDAQQRRGPKVEHIPARSNPVAPLDPVEDKSRESGVPEGRLPALEAQRKALLQQIAESATRGGAERGQGMQKQLEAFAELSARLDKVNPEGAAARRAEAEAMLQKLIKGERR
jgi:hypothetical protein